MTDPNTPAWLRYQSALAQDASEQTGSIAAAFMARSLALRAEAAETDERVAASLSRCRALLDRLESLG